MAYGQQGGYAQQGGDMSGAYGQGGMHNVSCLPHLHGDVLDSSLDP